jgi:hypothetical protein
LRFERTVALLASEQPEREDWHAFPGAVPREEPLTESGLKRCLARLPDRRRGVVGRNRVTRRKRRAL